MSCTICPRCHLAQNYGICPKCLIDTTFDEVGEPLTEYEKETLIDSAVATIAYDSHKDKQRFWRGRKSADPDEWKVIGDAIERLEWLAHDLEKTAIPKGVFDRLASLRSLLTIYRMKKFGTYKQHKKENK